jgi:HEAT repeat protein
MVQLQWLLATGLAASLFMPANVLANLMEQQTEPRPMDEDFQKQVKRLDQKNAKPDRVEAARWINRHSNATNAYVATTALEKCIREDPDAEVRSEAVQSRAKIAEKRQESCPLVIVQAMLDKDEMVSQFADAHANGFKTFSPGSVDVLLLCAKSQSVRLRNNCLCHLVRAGAKDKRVIDTLEKARRDKNFGVRHNAQVAMFQATNNSAEFVEYLVRLQQDPDGMLGQTEPDSESGKAEREGRDLAVMASAFVFVEWSDKRPDDLAPALMKLLDDSSPRMRRGAARLIGASVVKTDLPDNKAKPSGKTLPEPSKVKKPAQRSNSASRFEALKTEARLRKLRDEDPDPTVKAAAQQALEQFALVGMKDQSR